MNKKVPQIFYLNSRDEEINLIKAIQKQLAKRKYSEVIKASLNAKNKFPKNYFFYEMASIAYLELDQPKNAIKLLMESEKYIPNNGDIKFHLAKAYEQMKDYSKAEECYRSALDSADYNDPEFRSDTLNDLGALLINMGRNDEALECWKSALMENPKNVNAQNNIRIFTNRSKKPAEPYNLFDDLHNFQSIQTAKYLKDKNSIAFVNKEELEFCINKIMNAWNTFIAPNKQKLDSLSAEQKSEWFRSVEILFDNDQVAPKNEKKKSIKKTNPIKAQNKTNDLQDASWDVINKKFSFLPEEGLLMVMYGSAALLAAGMPGDRFLEILDTGDYDEEEEELMYWAFEIAVIVMQSLIAKNQKEKFTFLKEAKDIAEEFIEIEEVDYVISLIQATLKKEFIDKPKTGKKSKK